MYSFTYFLLSCSIEKVFTAIKLVSSTKFRIISAFNGLVAGGNPADIVMMLLLHLVVMWTNKYATLYIICIECMETTSRIRSVASETEQ